MPHLKKDSDTQTDNNYSNDQIDILSLKSNINEDIHNSNDAYLNSFRQYSNQYENEYAIRQDKTHASFISTDKLREAFYGRTNNWNKLGKVHSRNISSNFDSITKPYESVRKIF